MPEPLRRVPPTTVVTGWDFSTGSVKCLAFDLAGNVIAEERYPTELWTEGGVSELSLLQLEGQARATTRGIAAKLRDLGRLGDWLAGGVSATHHTAGRIDAAGNPVRRAICWNDQTLARYHAEGLERLGGQDRVQELIGGPWAVRYSLSHLVKDGHTLPPADWTRTKWVAQHGSLAAGYLTGRFDCVSVSSAASTGLLDLRTNQWRREMLGALASAEHREQAWAGLPRVIDMFDPVGPLSESVALDAGLPAGVRPVVFPTLDDQAAGLIGGGAVTDGQLAIILGNSAVVNSSSDRQPRGGSLDVMKLNWGPYLWMRCYSNGAQFLDKVVGANADWKALTAAARDAGPGAGGTEVLPFLLSEPSVGVTQPRVQWFPGQPEAMGVRVRAAFEALAYLIALAVEEHEAAGQAITQVTVSGGIARNDLMLEILASVLNRDLTRLASDEGTALGAAVVALAGLETQLRRQAGDATLFGAKDAAAVLVKFRDQPARPNPQWVPAYKAGQERFKKRLRG